jgi:hypothetical protein
MRKQGWQVDTSAITTTGFPLNLRQTIGTLTLTDPDQTGITISNLVITAKAYWPGYVSVKLPSDAITIVAQGASLYVQFDDATADVRLRPGTTLQLQMAKFTSGLWQVNETSGNLLTGQDLTASLQQAPQSPRTYAFDISAAQLSPGDMIRTLVKAPSGAPLTFDSFEAIGTTRFDRNLDRKLIGGVRALPEALTLTQAEVKWGNIGVVADAELTFNPQGIPTGQINGKINNWRTLLEYARGAGALSEQQNVQAGIMLGIFANMSGTPEDLSVTMRAADGQLNVNGINLGQAPQLFSR